MFHGLCHQALAVSNATGLVAGDGHHDDDVSPASASHDTPRRRALPKLSMYQYVFILAQLLHGIGAAALITLGTTLVDESVSKKTAPIYIGIFEASFVLGPALG